MLLTKKEATTRANAINNILKYCIYNDNNRKLYIVDGRQTILAYYLACELYIPSESNKYGYSVFNNCQTEIWAKNIAPNLVLPEKAKRVNNIQDIYNECVARLKEGIKIVNYDNDLYYNANLLKWLIAVVAPKNTQQTYIGVNNKHLVIESEFGIGITTNVNYTKEQYNNYLRDISIANAVKKAKQSKVLENIA